MNTIRELEIKPGYSNYFHLPADSHVLGVQRDGASIALWITVPASPEACSVCPWHFPIYRNGEEVPNTHTYVGTVKVIGDTYHVFARTG